MKALFFGYYLLLLIRILTSNAHNDMHDSIPIYTTIVINIFAITEKSVNEQINIAMINRGNNNNNNSPPKVSFNNECFRREANVLRSGGFLLFCIKFLLSINIWYKHHINIIT